MERPRYIAVDGPIGSGKTRFATQLAERLGARLVCETPNGNPFLGAFYADRARHALQTQLFFLLERWQRAGELRQVDLFAPVVVSDFLFAKDRIYAGLVLEPAERALYAKVAALVAKDVPRPDLVVYLRARPEVLLGRVQARNLAAERTVDLAYVSEVSAAFNDFFFHYAESALVVVDTSALDLERSHADFESVFQAIRRHRGGVAHLSLLGSARADRDT
jgi:deoxyadenosine/deoxycytidine kinase